MEGEPFKIQALYQETTNPHLAPILRPVIQIFPTNSPTSSNLLLKNATAEVEMTKEELGKIRRIWRTIYSLAVGIPVNQASYKDVSNLLNEEGKEDNLEKLSNLLVLASYPRNPKPYLRRVIETLRRTT